MGARVTTSPWLAAGFCVMASVLVADEPSAPAGAADGVELGSLARLAQLEMANGNGGADTEEAAQPLAGYDKSEGFFIRDKTGDNYLRIGVQLQIRYSYFARDKRGEDVGADEVGSSDTSAIELERARLVAEGNVLSKNLTYKYQGDGDTDGAGAWKTLDAYVEYWLGADLTGDQANASLMGIGIGQFKPFFLRQESASSSRLQMVERNITNEFFNIDRNLGLWVRGDLIGDKEGPGVFYAFAMTNGFDSVNVRPNAVDNVPAFVGKLDFQLWGSKIERGKYEEGNPRQKELFTVGLSAASDYNNNSNNLNGLRYQVYELGLDTQFKASIFSVQAEYIMRWLDYQVGNTAIPGGRGDAQFAHGGYVQAGVLIIPDYGIELTARCAAIWCDDAQDGNGVEVGPGINWYISGDHKIKLQADVGWFDISGNLQDSTEDLDGSFGSGGNFASSFESTSAGVEAGEQGLLLRTQLQLSF